MKQGAGLLGLRGHGCSDGQSQRGVSRLLCKRPRFVLGIWVWEGAVPLPQTISLEVRCAFIVYFSPRPASVPARKLLFSFALLWSMSAMGMFRQPTRILDRH